MFSLRQRSLVDYVLVYHEIETPEWYTILTLLHPPKNSMMNTEGSVIMNVRTVACGMYSTCRQLAK